jgi:hypothetical protein
MLEADRIISRPGNHVRSACWHDLIAAGTSIVLLGACPGDLAHEPVAIRMTLTPLPAHRDERPLVITPVIDTAILPAHD